MLKRVLMTRWLIVAATLLMLGAVTPAAADDVADCNSDNPDLRIRGCTSVIEAGRYEGDNLAIAYTSRGTAYSEKGEYDRAIADFDRAIQLNPDYAFAYYDRGNAYFDKNDLDRAIADYTEVIRIEPDDADAYYNRGAAYHEKGDTERAAADCNRARQIDPNTICAATAAQAQSSADVKLVQEKLADYRAGDADGIMGGKTRAAIRAYQEDWEIAVTEEVTPDLIARLTGEHPATKDQWSKIENIDCTIWNRSPQAQEVVTWSGGCLNGKASGAGTVIRAFVKLGDATQSQYEGEYREGKAHGRGVLWGAGDRYEGEWQDDKQHWQGVYLWANGDRYEGAWRDDDINGQGVRVWADGDRYEGAWRDGDFNGLGVYVWANGDRYEGEWRDGHSNGHGVYVWADGDRYDGGWQDDKPHGQGTGTVDGKQYSGEDGCITAGSDTWSINRSEESCGFQ